MTIFISGKGDFGAKIIIDDKEKHNVMVKLSICQEYLAI